MEPNYQKVSNTLVQLEAQVRQQIAELRPGAPESQPLADLADDVAVLKREFQAIASASVAEKGPSTSTSKEVVTMSALALVLMRLLQVLLLIAIVAIAVVLVYRAYEAIEARLSARRMQLFTLALALAIEFQAVLQRAERLESVVRRHQPHNPCLDLILEFIELANRIREDYTHPQATLVPARRLQPSRQLVLTAEQRCQELVALLESVLQCIEPHVRGTDVHRFLMRGRERIRFLLNRIKTFNPRTRREETFERIYPVRRPSEIPPGE